MRPAISPAERQAIRDEARRRLAADARQRGDLWDVEFYERRTLPEIERWAIAEAGIMFRRHGVR